MIAKLSGWLILILVAVWVVTNPVGAGHDLHHWFSSILTFFGALANG